MRRASRTTRPTADGFDAKNTERAPAADDATNRQAKRASGNAAAVDADATGMEWAGATPSRAALAGASPAASRASAKTATADNEDAGGGSSKATGASAKEGTATGARKWADAK